MHNENTAHAGKWKNQVCNVCGTPFYINIEWAHPPHECEFCRVRRIDKKTTKLMGYIRKLRAKNISKMTEEENLHSKEIAAIKSEYSRLAELHENNEREIFEGLIGNKTVRRILILQAREARISRGTSGGKRHSINYGQHKAQSVTGFVQGGSPGLRKK